MSHVSKNNRKYEEDVNGNNKGNSTQSKTI